jgi:alpha-L-fucosidase 2
MAQEHIQLMFEKSIFSNLFDAHPPFQIDGNFGYTAGVAELLLQSYEENTLRLLPALPPLWKKGNVNGLKARNNILVSMQWDEGKLIQAELIAQKDTEINLIYQNKFSIVKLIQKQPYIFKIMD